MKNIVRSMLFFLILFSPGVCVTGSELTIKPDQSNLEAASEYQVVEAIPTKKSTILTYNDYEYSIMETSDQEKVVVLHTYLGKEERIILPSEIDQMKVRILKSALIYENDTVVSVTIPDTIQTIEWGVFATANALEEIIATGDKKTGFHSIDGVLFFMTNVLQYPAAKKGSFYAIPNDSNTTYRYSFYRCKYLEQIVIPESIFLMIDRSFCLMEKSIEVCFRNTNLFELERIDQAFYQLEPQSRALVKTEIAKSHLDNYLKNTSVYTDYKTNPRVLEIGIFNEPATDLTFASGLKEETVILESYTNYELNSIYRQSPQNTSEVIRWDTDSVEIAVVDEWGRLTTKRGGIAILTGKDESNHSIKLKVKVYKKMESFGITMEPGPLRIGEARSISSNIFPSDSFANIYQNEIASSDERIVKASMTTYRSGLLEGIYPGKATITYMVFDNEVLVSKEFEIEVKAKITDCVVDPIPAIVDDENFSFPIPVVRYRNKVLKENVDYRIVHLKNSSFGYVNIYGKNFYSGLAEHAITPCLQILYEIKEAKVEQTKEEIPDIQRPVIDDLEKDDLEKDEDEQKELARLPVSRNYVKVYKKNDRFNLWVANHKGKTTYTSSNKKVVRIGKDSGKIKVVGMGTATISISAENGKTTSIIKITPGKPQITRAKRNTKGKGVIRWSKTKYALGYQIQYAENETFTKGVRSVKISNNYSTKKELFGLKKKKKYFVRVRAYTIVEGKTHYGSFSKTKQIK